MSDVERPPFAATDADDAKAMLGGLLRDHDCLVTEAKIIDLKRILRDHATEREDRERAAGAEIARLHAEVARLRTKRTPWYLPPLAAVALAWGWLVADEGRRHNAARAVVLVDCVALARFLGGL